MVIANFSSCLTVTLEAYIDKYTSLVPNLADAAAWTPASDPPPPEQTSKAISLRVSRFSSTANRCVIH